VKNAARAMAKFGISSLLVFSEEGLKGILTERDIITRSYARVWTPPRSQSVMLCPNPS
jgi:CBS domain-containing protein